MIILAILGVIINLGAAYFTKEGDSLNQKAVNLHMLEDVLGWVVVLIGAILMHFTDIAIIDSILSILVALFIFYNAFKNIIKIGDLFLEKTPDDIDIKALKKDLLTIKGVKDVHHIHIRSLDGFNNFATMHIVTEKYDSALKEKVRERLHGFKINHSTIEIELPNEDCHNKQCELKIDKKHHH